MHRQQRPHARTGKHRIGQQPRRVGTTEQPGEMPEASRAVPAADQEDMGLVAKASSPEEFGTFLQSEMVRWKAVLK